MPREDYEARQKERVSRFKQYAESAERRAKAAYRRFQKIGNRIPPGQPILVGHHSEKRHRRDLERMDNAMQKSAEEKDKAKYWRRRAAAAKSNRRISKHDPEAIEKLRAKIEKAEAYHEKMKAANKIIRSNAPDGEKVEELEDLGLSHSTAVKALEPDPMGRTGFPPYALKNSRARIRRMQKRIEDLERERAREAVTEDVGKCRVEESDKWDSTQIFFPGKPTEDLRDTLKSEGWRWARRAKCWYKKRRTDATLKRARELAGMYEPARA